MSHDDDVRRVLMIGSSGGGTATLGHTQTEDLVGAMERHFRRAMMSSSNPSAESASSGVVVILDTVLWVSLNDGRGLDATSGNEPATLLYFIKNQIETPLVHGTLEEINQDIRNDADRALAGRIERGEYHGLVSVSSAPHLLPEAFRAAAASQIPVTGTGGTSLGILAAQGLNLVGNAGGSVATTPETKAISFCGSLARTWGLKYKPWKAKRDTNISVPTVTSVLNGCLPAFWALMLWKRLAVTLILPKLHTVSWLSETLQHEKILTTILESYALPTVCSVVMASSRRKTEGVVMAAVLAGCGCRGTVLGGLFAGWLVAFGEERLLYECILSFNLPATMTNLLTSGFVGVVVATLMAFVAPILAAGTELYRRFTMEFLWSPMKDPHSELVRILCVSFLGSLFCYGSKVGWYHSVFLPLILIEMETGNASILGALDFLSLVLVCAGVCLGLCLIGSLEGRRLAKRGIAINLLCGDFVEACYPHMEQQPFVSYAGYLASAVAATVLTADCGSSAYLPTPIALWLANDVPRLLAASAIAFGIPFIATVTNHVLQLLLRRPKVD